MYNKDVCFDCIHENDHNHDDKDSACALCYDGSNFEDKMEPDRCRECGRILEYDGSCSRCQIEY